MEPDDESGFVLVLLIVLVAGMILAAGASFFVVSLASNATPNLVDAPLVTYDAR